MVANRFMFTCRTLILSRFTRPEGRDGERAREIEEENEINRGGGEKREKQTERRQRNIARKRETERR